MAKYDRRRILGAFSLALLAVLIAQSYYAVPLHWGNMPATQYVADHVKDFEGKEIYIDGTVSDETGNGTAFYLNTVARGLSSGIAVRTNDSSLEDGQSGVNVHGTVRNGVLEADQIRVSPIPGYMESFFNLTGFFFFIYFSLKEWKVKKKFPFIEEAP
ncbi:MAG: hypothetical protein WAX07_08080 [Candidatus Altiarchaeia archaeon]